MEPPLCANQTCSMAGNSGFPARPSTCSNHTVYIQQPQDACPATSPASTSSPLLAPEAQRSDMSLNRESRRTQKMCDRDLVDAIFRVRGVLAGHQGDERTTASHKQLYCANQRWECNVHTPDLRPRSKPRAAQNSNCPLLDRDSQHR